MRGIIPKSKLPFPFLTLNVKQQLRRHSIEGLFHLPEVEVGKGDKL